MRLAGKRILWNMVPGEEEANYDDYVMSLYAGGVLTPNEWLDLGGLGTLSAEEYFGASLWQLYKSIDSPYKAVLKTLLLESYTREYPDTRLLAMDIKQRLHDGEIVSFGLDPYCMMLEKVTRYLQDIDDPARLDLVRRCFYLKACEKLSVERPGAVLCGGVKYLARWSESGAGIVSVCRCSTAVPAGKLTRCVKPITNYWMR